MPASFTASDNTTVGGPETMVTSADPEAGSMHSAEQSYNTSLNALSDQNTSLVPTTSWEDSIPAPPANRDSAMYEVIKNELTLVDRHGRDTGLPDTMILQIVLLNASFSDPEGMALGAYLWWEYLSKAVCEPGSKNKDKYKYKTTEEFGKAWLKKVSEHVGRTCTKWPVEMTTDQLDAFTDACGMPKAWELGPRENIDSQHLKPLTGAVEFQTQVEGASEEGGLKESAWEMV